MVIQIPAPETLLQITWTIMGFMFARAFGKQFDQTIQGTDWWATASEIEQFIMGGILNFFHHFWIGLLLMVYCSASQEFYWFGYGLFIDDLPDIPNRFRRYFDYLFTDNDE